MSVTLVGSVGNARFTSGAATGTYGQTPTANNTLIAVVTGTSTTATTTTVTCSTTGWKRLFPASFGGPLGTDGLGTTGFGLIDVWGLPLAAGGDAAPVFTIGLGGTETASVSIFELNGANQVSPLNIGSMGWEFSGTSASTITFSSDGWQPLTAGDFAISVFVQESTTTFGGTWTETGTGWTSGYDDSATTSSGHRRINYQAAPTATADLTDAGYFSTNTTAYGVGMIFSIVPPGVNEDPSELANNYFDIGVTAPSATQAAISPPAGSMGVALVEVGYSTVSSSDAPAVTVSDSAGNTWTPGPAVFDTTSEWAGIYYHYYPAAPGSITVTAANSDAAHGNSGINLDTRVATGAAAVPGARATAFSATAVTANTGSITTTTPGSLVLMALSSGSGTAGYTPNSATITGAGEQDATDGATYLPARAANRTTTPGSLTLGYTSSVAATYAWAALEILPAVFSKNVMMNQAVMRAAVW